MSNLVDNNLSAQEHFSTAKTNYSAQQDTTHYKFGENIILKINPTSMFVVLGATIQFTLGEDKVGHEIAGYLGGGDNYGAGYTINTGFYFFLKKKRYLSLQFLYRTWNFYNLPNYYSLYGDTYDIILPFNIIYGSTPNPSNRVYEMDNYFIHIYSFDLLYGKQYDIKNAVFQWYCGLGFRIKNISIQKMGNYSNLIYYPLSNPYYYSDNRFYPIIKLGVNIGFKFKK